MREAGRDICDGFEIDVDEMKSYSVARVTAISAVWPRTCGRRSCLR